jgi:hypothetical protein
VPITRILPIVQTSHIISCVNKLNPVRLLFREFVVQGLLFLSVPPLMLPRLSTVRLFIKRTRCRTSCRWWLRFPQGPLPYLPFSLLFAKTFRTYPFWATPSLRSPSIPPRIIAPFTLHRHHWPPWCTKAPGPAPLPIEPLAKSTASSPYSREFSGGAGGDCWPCARRIVGLVRTEGSLMARLSAIVEQGILFAARLFFVPDAGGPSRSGVVK